MSQVVACFETVRSSGPSRTLLYMPATGAEWSADYLWQAHQRYAERLTQMEVGSGDLAVSAAGNSAASVAVLLACRAVDAAVLPVDPGTTPHELMAVARRLGVRALLMPAGAAHDPGPDTAHTRLLDEPMCLSPAPKQPAGAIPGGRAEADVRIDERSENGDYQRSAADRGQHSHPGRHEYHALRRAVGHHPGFRTPTASAISSCRCCCRAPGWCCAIRSSLSNS